MSPSTAIRRSSSTPSSVPSMKLEKYASKNGTHSQRWLAPSSGRGTGVECLSDASATLGAALSAWVLFAGPAPFVDHSDPLKTRSNCSLGSPMFDGQITNGTAGDEGIGQLRVLFGRPRFVPMTSGNF